MNYKCNFVRRFGLFALALLAMAPFVRAQDAPRHIDIRYLLVFDTSFAMKKRVPSEEKAIEGIFAITLDGQLQRGDSIGAWSFSRDLQTGEFPLEYWEPGGLMDITTNLVGFVRSRHYAHSTSFDELTPVLNRVVRNSARLTIIIFCDGDGQIHGTPIDEKINSIFKHSYSTMKKARQPFVVVLRSQFGQYISFSINTADSVTITPFPPLPEPPAPDRTVPAPAPPAPAPLIIIGTHVGTNVPPATLPPVAPPPQTPVPTPPAPAPATPPHPTPTPAPANPSSENTTPENNRVQPMAVAPPTTNTVAATPETENPPATPTMPGAIASPASAPAPSKKHWLAASVAAVVLISVLGFLLFRPRPRPSPSLISESMKK
jgi:hypothetical protein